MVIWADRASHQTNNRPIVEKSISNFQEKKFFQLHLGGGLGFKNLDGKIKLPAKVLAKN